MKKKIISDPVRFSPSIETGLLSAEVALRQQNGEYNRVKDENEKTYFQIVFENCFTFFNLLMIAIAFVLMFVVGPSTILNLSFIVLMLVNTAIGTFQQIKSKKAVKKLKLLSSSKIQVLRAGKIEEIYSEDIVLDEIIILKTGDQVPADCIIMSEETVDVNESILTGESHSVKKSKDMELLAGSFIISGQCYAHAVKLGVNTYIHSIESKAKGFSKPKSHLMLSINKIIKILASIAIPLAIVVFVNEIISQGPSNYKNAVLYACLTIPYMIPAGMMLLSSVSMATGVVKLANKNVLAADLYSVEALSRINTLCLDKTGTLTDGTMTVEKSIILGQGDIESIISSYLSAFKTTNATSEALIKKYGNKQYMDVSKVLEFSSTRKYSAVQFATGEIYMLGAPEYLTNDKEILTQSKDFAQNGLRVILMCKATGKITEDVVDVRTIKHFALFVIRDNIRPEVYDTMQWFAENDVDIKVISGDNLETVSYIARHSGIANWDKCIDMSKLASEDNLEKLVMKNSIFARVSPEQKAEIVDILKKNKRVVGMSGDGINDIISLKKADCSIALANGCQATKNISNLVLLDSNFANMKEAVFEGRRVVNNIQRSSILFIMKDFLWMFITIWPILIGMPHVLESTVMTLVSTFITGIGSLFLALEPDRSRIEGNFLKTVIGKGIVSGFYMFLPVVFSYIYAFIVCGLDVAVVSQYVEKNMFPVISICIAISGFIILYNLCKPFTRYRRGVFAFVLVLVIGLLLLIPDFFLRNGTDFIKELSEIYGNNPAAIIIGIWNSIFSFAIYKTLTLPQWIVIGSFLILSFALYQVIDHIVSRILNITMFNPHRFDEG